MSMAAIARRLRSVLRFGVLVRSDDSKAVRTLQARVGDEILSDIEHLEPYGFTSRAKTKAELVLAALKGNPAHTACLVTGGRAFRLKNLAEGEVAIYDDLGNVIHFMRDKIKVNAVGHTELTSPTTEIISAVTITGTLHVTGEVTADKKVTATLDCVGGGKSLIGHTHPGDSGGNTGPPN